MFSTVPFLFSSVKKAGFLPLPFYPVKLFHTLYQYPFPRSAHDRFFQKTHPHRQHPPSDGYRLCHQALRIFLPHISVPDHRSPGPGYFQYGTSCLRNLFRPVRRLHPDRHIPVCGRQCLERKADLPNRPCDLPGLKHRSYRLHHPLQRPPGSLYPLGGPLRLIASLYRCLRPLLRSPRLYQRLLLRH